MDLKKICGELRFEMEQLDQAILALERLVLARGKRRGRPAKWAKAAGAPAAKRGKRRTPEVNA